MYTERKTLRHQREFKKTLPPLLAILILSSLVYLVYFSGLFEIKQVKFIGHEEELGFFNEEIISKTGNPVYKNAVLFPRWEVRKVLLKSYPAIDQVNFSYDIKTKILNVSVYLREPVYLICSVNENSCLLADKKGFLFQTVDAQDWPDLFKLKTDKTVRLGEYIDFTVLPSMSLIIEKLNRLNFNGVSSVLLKSNGDLIFYPSGRPALYFNLNQDLDAQFQKLERFLSDKKLLLDFDLGKMEYINLTVPEKIFLK